jgi:hypothetical protein
VYEVPPPIATPTAVAVHVLRWPDDRALRQELSSTRRPRLLLVPAGAEPPPMLDELEDWLRAPADPAEVAVRQRNLEQRAAEVARPSLDADGLLRVGERWVAIPVIQLGVVELLLRRFGRLVLLEDLTAAYVRAGGSGKATSIKTVVSRLTHRLGSVGLQLKKVRGRGVVLMLPLPC